MGEAGMLDVGSLGARAEPDEITTALWIRPGSVIAIGGRESLVALDDEDATPVVEVPVASPVSSMRLPSRMTAQALVEPGDRVAAQRGSTPGRRVTSMAKVVAVMLVLPIGLAIVAGGRSRESSGEVPESAAARPVKSAPLRRVVVAPNDVVEGSPAPAVIARAPEAPKSVHEARLTVPRAGTGTDGNGRPPSRVHDVEALAGAGDAARAAGDAQAAVALYTRALSEDPRFLPAHLGLADVLWDGGDRARSVAEYRFVARTFAEVPPYVAIRAQLPAPVGREGVQ